MTGFQFLAREMIGFFLFTTMSILPLVPTQPPSQQVPGSKVARVWSWPLTSI